MKFLFVCLLAPWLLTTVHASSIEERLQAVESELQSLKSSSINDGDSAWVLTSAALVFVMTPGLGMFYAGLAGAENAGNTLMMSFVCCSLITLQWLFFGYSFAFGPGSKGFGSFQWAGLDEISKEPSAPSSSYFVTTPHLAFVAFQLMFAQITPALISGALVGRMKFRSYCVFVVLWSTLVYDPIAHWVWGAITNESGWLMKLGAIDFAGGTVIHITSGFGALVGSMIVGKRRNVDEELVPHNVPLVVVGTALIWFGWFGFNAGSAGAASGIAALAFINTQIGAASAFLTWMILESIVFKKASVCGVCVGAVVGLVSITPSCGFVHPLSAIAIGCIGAACSFLAVFFKAKLRYDDTLDVFACHGVGGVVGALCVGLFATSSRNRITDPDTGDVLSDGAFYGRPVLLGYQLAAIVVAAVLSSVGTASILFFLKYTIGIRVDETAESRGLDRSVHGTASYAMAEKNLRNPYADDDFETRNQTQVQVQPKRIHSIEGVMGGELKDDGKNLLFEQVQPKAQQPTGLRKVIGYTEVQPV